MNKALNIKILVYKNPREINSIKIVTYSYFIIFGFVGLILSFIDSRQ
jgi:hypothetical protein